MMVETVGAEAAAREMRKHVAWYVRGLPRSAQVREEVNRTRSVEEMIARLHLYVEELSGLGVAHEALVPAAVEEPEAEGLVATG